MNLTAAQIKTLNILLDKYERSKTYEGMNIVTQNFTVEPTAIWKEYTSDFTDVGKIKDFEADMEFLEKQGLLVLKRSRGEIAKITACNDHISEYYDILHRRSKKDAIQEEINFYRDWSKKGNPLVISYCEEQLERISSRKKTSVTMETAECIFRLLTYLMDNKNELLERELSTIVLSDSKLFETKYRSKICKLLREYMDFEDKLEGIDNEREREKIILEELGIYTNPSYVYLKGNVRIELNNGEYLKIGEEPIALSSEFIRKIVSITIESSRIVTVENMTSFHRIDDDGNTYIYLAGYHNTEKQQLLKRIAAENPGRKWLHFGDIDPDGFYILEHLKNGTGIDFEPIFMGIEQLKTYGQYCKPLNQNDLVKAGNLINKNHYVSTLQYMLESNCKLEQEIVSLQLQMG